MVEKESKKSIDPRILTPEYWGEHRLEDECKGYAGILVDIPPLKERGLRKNSIDILKTYLINADNQPTRRFEQGEVFDGNQVPEGTIVKMNWETLLGNEHYSNFNNWGVIAGFDTKEGRQIVIMCFISREDGTISTAESLPKASIVKVGSVEHARPGKNKSDGFYIKTNWLEIHSFGKGVRESGGKRFRIPSFGNILSPKPQIA